MSVDTKGRNVRELLDRYFARRREEIGDKIVDQNAGLEGLLEKYAASGASIEDYPTLVNYTDTVEEPVIPIVGRDEETIEVLSSLERPEVSNVALLGHAGSGKTTLVTKVSSLDVGRLYLEVDVSKLIGGDHGEYEIGNRIKSLFAEASKFGRAVGVEIVLFIDEVHQIVMLSKAAVEALKPGLAKSGTMGLRVIVATTPPEWHEHIAGNEPLRQRLQIVQMDPPDRGQVIEMLRTRAIRNGVYDDMEDTLFDRIYTYTERYQPRAVQPRKSILLLDGMIGRHNTFFEPIDEDLLATVLQTTTGINIAYDIDGTEIMDRLNERVLGQKWAVQLISRRLQLSVAGLNDKSRPELSAILCGSTGVGKDVLDSEPLLTIDPDGAPVWKTHGTVETTDRVIAGDGQVAGVLGVFPQGEKALMRVDLEDGRSLTVGRGHLWGVLGDSPEHPGRVAADARVRVMETRDLAQFEGSRIFVPVAGAAELPARDDGVTAGVIAGVVSGYGDDLVEQPETLPGELAGQLDGPLETRFIPGDLQLGSVAQRLDLARALFLADGQVTDTGEGYEVSYTCRSRRLARDLRHLLFGLGISSRLVELDRDGVSPAVECGETGVLWSVVVTAGDAACRSLFTDIALGGRLDGLIERYPRTDERFREAVEITGITDLGVSASTTCIYIDHPSHLYQAGWNHIVTHNTELSKGVAEIVFGDNNTHFLRYDMSEYALADSMERFRSKLTKDVSDAGHAVILFDEIEKAHIVNVRVLLQILDDGRLTDDFGQQVSFLNTYILITTNAGEEVFETIGHYEPSATGDGAKMKDNLHAVENSLRKTKSGFPPELLGRIDEIIPFQPLAPETHQAIVARKMKSLRDLVAREKGVRVNYTNKVFDYVTVDLEKGDASGGGARDSVRTLQREVATEIAVYLNAHPDVRDIIVGTTGELRSDSAKRRVSAARIVVYANDNVEGRGVGRTQGIMKTGAMR